MKRAPIRITLLDYPGAQQAALHGLRDLFDTASALAGKGSIQLLTQTVLLDGFALHRAPQVPDYVLIPPCLAGPAPLDRLGDLPASLRQLHRRGTRLGSICAGAFILAATGLLDGRAATTHWSLAQTFREAYPAVRLDVAKMVVDLDDIVTGGGVMAWIDVGLRLIERHLGEGIKLETARMFLVDPASREQSFYAQLSPSLAHGDEGIRHLQSWMQLHLDQPLDIARLAQEVNLGQRTLLRRFKLATGDRPLQYLQRLRVEAARSQLESSRVPIGDIAAAVGYSNESAFRRIFQREMGITPGAYRQRYSKRT